MLMSLQSTNYNRIELHLRCAETYIQLYCYNTIMSNTRLLLSHAYVCACTHACTHTHTQNTHINTHTRYMQTHTQAHTHTRKHTHTHTHKHKIFLSPVSLLLTFFNTDFFLMAVSCRGCDVDSLNLLDNSVHNWKSNM